LFLYNLFKLYSFSNFSFKNNLLTNSNSFMFSCDIEKENSFFASANTEYCIAFFVESDI